MRTKLFTRRSRRLVATIAAAGVVAAGLAACSTGGSTAAHSSITVAVSSAPTTLDPAKGSNTADSQMFYDLAYEPLINLKSDGSLGAGLATSWKYTDSTETKFQLTLRKGVKFSDGKTLTAAGVVASINHEKSANGPVAVYVNEIKSAVAINPTTVQLNLIRPNSTIAFVLTQRFLIGSVVGPDGLANPTALGTSTDGAGQYMLDKSLTVANDHYTFVPNPHYYNPSAIKFKKFTVKIIPNPQTALNALKSGQISYVGGAFSSASQAKAAGLQVFSTPSSWYSLFLFDRNGTLVPALASQQVRQALNYAIDRTAIAKALFSGYGTPTDEVSIKGYESDGYDPSYVNHYAYNPAKAKQLLAAAGYPNGFTLTVGATPTPGNGVQIAQAVAADWAKIGVTANIQSYASVNDMVTPWLGAKLPVTTWYYDAQPMFIEAGQAIVKDAGIFNPFKTDDSKLDTLLDKAYAETDKSKQPAAWAAVEDRIVDLGWFAPVVSGDSLYFGAKNLKGVKLSPTAFVPNPTTFSF